MNMKWSREWHSSAPRSDPARAISDVNPPGLDRTDGAPFLTDLRATAPVPASQIPTNLTTGCFAGPVSDKTPGVDECTGRVTHHTLTKDHGIINLDGTFGAAGPDTPRAELVPGNFERAVRAAVQGTRDAWAALRAELRQQYCAAKGELMICSLVRDNPVKDCGNRTVSYVLDRSWQAWFHNAGEIERLAAQTLNSKLANDGTDQVTVIHFQGEAEIVSAWGDPDSSGLGTLDVPHADTPSNPGGALSLAIDQIIAANPDTYTDRGAVLLLGAGGESRDYVGDTLLQVQRAAAEGIRVHYGCVNPPPLPDDPIYAESVWSECWPGDGVVAAVLKTGGAFAYVSSRAGRTPADFASLVMNRGLTTSDDLDGADSTILSPGLTIADFLSPEVASKYFSYSASAGEHLNFTVQDRVLDDQGTGGCFSMILMDKVKQVQIAMFESCTGSVPSYLVYDATAPVELVLLGQYGSGSIGAKRQQPVEGEIVFTVELFTNMPEKNETTTTTTMMMTTTSSSSSSTSAVDSSTSTSTTAQESTTQESTTQDSTTTSTSEALNTAQSTESSSSSSDSSSDSTSTSSTSSESSTSSSSTATTSASSTRKACNKRRRTARALPSPTTSR